MGGLGRRPRTDSYLFNEYKYSRTHVDRHANLFATAPCVVSRTTFTFAQSDSLGQGCSRREGADERVYSSKRRCQRE